MQLQHLYMKTGAFLHQLDTEFMKSLQKSWKDLRTTLEESIKQVEPQDQYVVLVAGKILPPEKAETQQHHKKSYYLISFE